MSQADAPHDAAAGWSSLLSAAAAVAQPSAHTQTAASLTASSTAGSAPAPFQRLHRDGLQSVFTLLSSDDLWSARRVCAAWIQAAQAERRRRLIALQLEAVTLISTNAAAATAWKELCAASDPVPSLQSNVLSMLARVVSGPPLSAAATPQHASESQLVAAHKLLSALVSSSVPLRDDLLSRGVLQSLMSACTEAASVSVLRGLASCLEALTRLSPQSPVPELRAMLPTLARLLYTLDDETCTHTLTALAVLSDDATPSHSQIQSVLESGVGRRVTELLMHRALPVRAAALSVVVHLSRGTDVHKQVLINCGALPCLLALLVHPNKSIRKDACRTVGHITTGNTEQIECVIQAYIIPPLVSILRNEDCDIQKEAARAISHALRGGSDAQIRYLAKQGVIPPLCELLTGSDHEMIPDEETVLLALEAIERILRVGKADAAADHLAINQYADQVDHCGGLDSLEALQEHESEAISLKAASIVSTCFVHDDDE